MRYTTEVHVQDFTFLSTKKESMANAQSSGSSPSNYQEPAGGQSPAAPMDTEEDDDLPF